MTVADSSVAHDGPRRGRHARTRKTTLPARTPAGTCNAVGRSGAYCTQRPGWGTSHFGTGRCRLHGGATPIKSGRWSTITRPRLGDLVAEHAADPNPLDMLPDLAMARAMLHDFVERFDEFRDALMTWHASWGGGLGERFAAVEAARRGGDVQALRQALSDLGGAVAAVQESRPRTVLDISSATQQIEVISRMVARIQSAAPLTAISRKDFRRLVAEMALRVDEGIDLIRVDDDQRDTAKEYVVRTWKAIRLS